MTGLGQDAANPETVSLHVKDTVTSALFQPLELAPREREALIVGAVLSMLIPVTEVDAELPAASTALPAPL